MTQKVDPTSLIAAGIPPSLLADLVGDAGPASAEILAAERPDAAEMAWLQPRSSARDEEVEPAGEA